MLTITKTYDFLNRLTGIASTPVAAPAVNFDYNYNAANQRTRNTLVDGSYWVYQYDVLGQVTSGKKYFADGTFVPGQEFDYSFDDIGNRVQTKTGGDSAGTGLRLASYSVNNLNQITSRDYPGTNEVVGVALATNGVTVNGQTAWRKGEYFWSTVGTNNAGSAKWLGVTVASGGTTSQGNVYLAKTPEALQYDADGNLTNDGRWAYVWDAENRLVQMTVNTNVGPQYQLTFGYDAKSRRIQKVVATNGVAVATNKFLYDGWNLVAELGSSGPLVRSYTWGTDLSGSLQGAGGVGGLLAVSYYGTGTTNCFATYDGNGNVAGLVNGADGTLAANYEYGPFGEVIRATGPMAKVNPFRFSSKYQDEESDLLYYGYRYYKASTGTWVSRDPDEEDGGDNIYGIVDANAINSFDALGLKTITLNFGFDSSAKANPKTIKAIQAGILFFNEMLIKCLQKKSCDCPGVAESISLRASYDYNNQDKPAPSNLIYDVSDQSDYKLFVSNIGKISGGKGDYRCLITTSAIKEVWPPGTTQEVFPIAVTQEGLGTLYNVKLAANMVIAHEFGHFVGYGGDAPDDKSHSKDEGNLMYKYGGDTPDCQWCQKVHEFAK